MNKAQSFNRLEIDPELLKVNLWPTVDTNNIPEEKIHIYRKREKAIIKLIDSGNIDDICNDHKITRPELYRFVQRCLEIHPDGRIWGFRALIPYKRCKSYQRLKPVRVHTSDKSGDSGALMQLFDRFPEIKDTVDNLFLKKREKGVVHEARIPIKAIHKRFVEKCRDKGLTTANYPFTAKYLGYKAISNYLRQLYLRETSSAVRARNGIDVARMLNSSNTGITTADAISRPYQRVEFDGHRIDAFFTVSMPSLHIGTEDRVLERLWILAIKDTASRAILGYYLCLNREYNADDVLQCVKNAVIPWKPKTLTIPALRYPQKGGLPSGVIPQLAWATWDELAYDNAKANLAERVRDQLTHVIGCAVNAGPVQTPDRRGFIERFFGSLEENGFHRLPSTTGNHSRDTRRYKAEEAALKYNISLGDLEQLLDVLIAQYNATPHSGIAHRSPLEYLEYFLSDKNSLIRTIPENQRNKLGLLDIRMSRMVRGNPAAGRRPYISVEGVRYQNEVLARTPELIGKRLTLIVNPEDLRSVTVYLLDGSELGILTAKRPWNRTPHTLEIRREINRLSHKKMLHFTQEDDPIEVYMKYLSQQTPKKKRARNQYAKAKQVIKEHNNPSAAPKKDDIKKAESVIGQGAEIQRIGRTITF